MYIYIYICRCVCIHIYIYIYIYVSSIDTSIVIRANWFSVRGRRYSSNEFLSSLSSGCSCGPSPP